MRGEQKPKRDIGKSEIFLTRILHDALSGNMAALNSVDKLPDGEPKEFLLALIKELSKMIEKRKRFLNKQFLFAPSPGKEESRIEKALIKEFTKRGYGEDVLHRTQKLWRDFVREEKPSIRDIEPWVAALDFIVSGHTPGRQREERITQKSVAEEYGVPLNRLGPCYRRIKKAVETSHYFSHGADADTMYRLLIAIINTFKRFPGAGSEEAKEVRAYQQWLDALHICSSALRTR